MHLRGEGEERKGRRLAIKLPYIKLATTSQDTLSNIHTIGWDEGARGCWAGGLPLPEHFTTGQ